MALFEYFFLIDRKTLFDARIYYVYSVHRGLSLPPLFFLHIRGLSPKTTSLGYQLFWLEETDRLDVPKHI